MAFTEISPPNNADLAVRAPIVAVCDYDPDILENHDFWRGAANSDKPHLAQLGQAFAPMLKLGREIRFAHILEMRQPREADMMKLLGLLTMSMLLRKPDFTPTEVITVEHEDTAEL